MSIFKKVLKWIFAIWLFIWKCYSFNIYFVDVNSFFVFMIALLMMLFSLKYTISCSIFILWKEKKSKNFNFNFLASRFVFFYIFFQFCFFSSDILWYLFLPYFCFLFFSSSDKNHLLYIDKKIIKRLFYQSN